MMQRIAYKPLAFRKLKPGSTFTQPLTYRPVTLDSPAIEVMTDLQRVAAATVNVEASLAQATQLMVARSVRMLLVVDSVGEILGLITARDTMGDRPVKFIQEHGGKHADLKVGDCMTPIDRIQVLAMSEVERAQVGHIVATLESVGRQHAMAVDVDKHTGEETVRGIFSVSQIGRQLGISLQTFEVAKTFSEIKTLLAA